TSGYDFSINYSSPTMELGTFNISWVNSMMSEYVVKNPSSTGFIEVHREGTELGDPEAAYPEWKSTLRADWMYQQWNVAWTLRYIDEVEESCTGLSDFPGLCSNPNETDDSLSTNTLDATLYNDIQLTWHANMTDGNLSVSAGINN